MKSHMNRLGNFIICLLGGILLLASCEQSEHDNNCNELSDKDGVCTILPPPVSIEPFGADAATRTGAATIKEQLYPIADELSSVLTIANTPEENTPQTRALAAGTYYQLVIYKQGDWENGTLAIAEQRLCKTGSTGFFDTTGNSITNPIQLSQGQYKMFCYSHNSTTPSNLTLSPGSTSLSMPDGTDFLSVVVDMEIKAAQLGTTVTVPNIVLAHRCCKLTGTLAATEFEGGNQISGSSPIPLLQVTGKFASSGIWNIKTSTPNTTTSSNSSTKTIPLQTSGENFSGSIIVLPLSAQILTATYSFKPEKAAATVSGTNKALSSTSTTFTAGSNHSFTIKAIGAYILSSAPPTIGGVKWATSNLKFNNTFAVSPWSGGQADDTNDYWRWTTAVTDVKDDLPSKISSTWSDSNDPCRKASGGGTWRIPTSAEAELLVAAVLRERKVYIDGEIQNTSSVGWIAGSRGRTAGTVFANGYENVVYVPAIGKRFGSVFSDWGESGRYWTGTRVVYDNLGRAYIIYVSPSACVLISESMKLGLSIRCVRDQ